MCLLLKLGIVNLSFGVVRGMLGICFKDLRSFYPSFEMGGVITIRNVRFVFGGSWYLVGSA